MVSVVNVVDSVVEDVVVSVVDVVVVSVVDVVVVSVVDVVAVSVVDVVVVSVVDVVVVSVVVVVPETQHSPFEDTEAASGTSTSPSVQGAVCRAQLGTQHVLRTTLSGQAES